MRILLFLGTNMAILLLVSIIIQVFGVDQWLYNSTGLNYGSLLLFCAVFGMGGSMVSLLMSKTMAKRSMGVRIISQPQNSTEQWLFDTVQQQAQEVGITMPEVGIFPSEAANAFATGASKNKALVAVSEGLLYSFDKEAVKAVMGHEMAHVANGDMVTMSLLQGVLNTFVLFFARIVGHIIDRTVFKNERGNGIRSFLISMVAQVVFGFLASIIVCWFSRYREFRADEGGAALAGRDNMILALQSLQRDDQPVQMTEQLAAFGIRSANLKALFATHPPLEKRIAHLKTLV